MSGLAGIYHRDGRPIDGAPVERMLALAAHRGPDGSGIWTGESISLGQCLLRTTPESPRDPRPPGTPDGRVRLVLDGRIDNRAELQRDLPAPATATDPELVLLAYERWGQDCPIRLIGDFAFAIWDARRRHVFCARDPSGLRPFFYFLDAGRFVFSSEPQQLVRGGGVPAEPNEAMAAEYLACAITHPTETLLRGVFRLSPGFTLTVAPDRASARRFWNPATSCDAAARSDDERAEQFRSLFAEAVRARLRAAGPVAVCLSGGVDSSAIAVTAAQVAGAPPAALTLAFPGAACDETAYARDVARRLDVPWTVVDARLPEAGAFRAQAQRYADVPDYPNGAMLDPLRAGARDAGARVLLNGNGGDQWFTSPSEAYADLAARGRLGALVRAARRDHAALGIDYTPYSIVRFGLWPLLPPRTRRLVSRAVRRLAGRPKVPAWIAPALARRVALDDRLRALPPSFGLRPRAREALCADATCAWEVHFNEMDDRATAAYGLEVRSPFLDRRIAEFAIALTDAQRQQGAHTRWIVRRALAAWLPAQVASRTTKADFSHVFVEALATREPEDADAAALARAEWIVPARVRALERRMRTHWAAADRRYLGDVWRVWMIHAAELWLSCLNGHSAGRGACSNLEPPGGDP